MRRWPTIGSSCISPSIAGGAPGADDHDDAAADGTESRPRDADLSARDRVDILLDPDRNYATCYRLTIDHRGWTAESCWGDTTWNPTWYVAAARDGDTWTVEAAVPWEELAGRPAQSNDAWAIGIERTVPGVGFQFVDLAGLDRRFARRIRVPAV